MTLSETPIVVHVRSPLVESISTRVTDAVPVAESSTRTLKSVRWMRVDLRVAWAEGFAQGGVEGVDGAIAFGDLHDALVPDVQL